MCECGCESCLSETPFELFAPAWSEKGAHISSVYVPCESEGTAGTTTEVLTPEFGRHTLHLLEVQAQRIAELEATLAKLLKFLPPVSGE